MRLCRITKAVVAPLLIVSATAFVAAPARADDTGPTINDVFYKVAANGSLAVSADVTGETSTHPDLEFAVFDSSDREVDLTATVTQTSATSYSGAAAAGISGFPDGDTLYVAAEATDDDGGDATYENDARTVTVDRTSPTVSLGSGDSGVTGPIALPITASDNLPGVTTTCAVDGGASYGCAGFAAARNAAIGRHSIVVTATDVAGNTASAVGTVYVTQHSEVQAGFQSACGCGVGIFEALHITSRAASDTGVAPGGTVTVSENGVTVGTAALQPTYTTGVSAADVLIRAGALGPHALQVNYSGDAISTPSSTTVSYTSIPSLRALVKPGRVVRGKLQFTVACPAGSTNCSGFLGYGKARARYVVSSGHRAVTSLALPKTVLTSLKAHRRVTLKLLFADNVKHSALVVHLH